MTFPPSNFPPGNYPQQPFGQPAYPADTSPFGFPPAGGPPPFPTPGGPQNKGLIIAVIAMAVVAVIAVTVAVVLLTQREDHTTPALATGTSAPNSVGPAPTSTCATFSDSTGDAERSYTDRGNYDVADITNVDVTCSDTDLTFTVTFASGGAISSFDFAVVIDVDPDTDSAWEASCPSQDGDDFSFAVAGFQGAGHSTLLSFSGCDRTPYPEVDTSTSTVSGNTLSASIPLSSLGVAAGDVIEINLFSGVLLDGGNVMDPGTDNAPDVGQRRLTIG